MALLAPNGAEVIMLGNFLNKSVPEDLDLKLYKSDTTPAETDTAVTYTEADFTGYAEVMLTAASWTITGGAPTEAAYAQQTFTSSATQTQTIYGYYLVQRTSGAIMWAQRLTTPFVIENNGDELKITPKITLE